MDAASPRRDGRRSRLDRIRRFSLGYGIDDRVRSAVEAFAALPEENKRRLWVPGIDADGGAKDGAEVADLTGFVDRSAWPVPRDALP